MKGNHRTGKQGFATAIRHGALLILLVLAMVITGAFIIGKTAMGSTLVTDIEMKGNWMNFEDELEGEHGAWAPWRRRSLVTEYGDFIEQLAEWEWYWTITFRDSFTTDSDSDNLRPPSKDWSLRAVDGFLRELQDEVGHRLIWVIGEDFGSYGRFHVHILVANVLAAMSISIDDWQNKAFRRFGRNQLDWYERGRGGAHYLAKHALTDTGGIHFGGAGLPEQKLLNTMPVGRVVVAKSADVPSSLFHMTLGRRRKR